ncbi:Uncharacterised protein [[Ruminococcus] torques]|nr:Uncharacterised protein [[Ruminococcus] torques]CUQ72842.1 Uncharacterised protein [[Ruminococcus] torques]
MRRGKCWKAGVRELCYCHQRLNRRIVCICRSFEEVYRILNRGYCNKDTGKKKRC